MRCCCATAVTGQYRTQSCYCVACSGAHFWDVGGVYVLTGQVGSYRWAPPSFLYVTSPLCFLQDRCSSPLMTVSKGCKVCMQTDFGATTETLDAHSNIDNVQANLRRFMGNGLPLCQLPPLLHLVRTCSLNTRAPALAPHGAQFLPTHSPWQRSLGASLIWKAGVFLWLHML